MPTLHRSIYCHSRIYLISKPLCREIRHRVEDLRAKQEQQRFLPQTDARAGEINSNINAKSGGRSHREADSTAQRAGWVPQEGRVGKWRYLQTPYIRVDNSNEQRGQAGRTAREDPAADHLAQRRIWFIGLPLRGSRATREEAGEAESSYLRDLPEDRRGAQRAL